MAKHKALNFKGKQHTSMKRIGSLIFAARVHESGSWSMAQGMWAK